MKIQETASKIKKVIDKVLTYFRINDEKGVLSLTNIALMLIIYKIYQTPAVSVTDITGLAIAVLGYQSKRLIEK